MAPPANLARIPVQRTPANVLSDLSEARRDWDQAISDMKNRVDWFDADDRCSEAEQRTDDLRAEFDRMLLSLTGLSVEQIMKARESCIL
jgi:hypothetical protein